MVSVYRHFCLRNQKVQCETNLGYIRVCEFFFNLWKTKDKWFCYIHKYKKKLLHFCKIWKSKGWIKQWQPGLSRGCPIWDLFLGHLPSLPCHLLSSIAPKSCFITAWSCYIASIIYHLPYPMVSTQMKWQKLTDSLWIWVILTDLVLTWVLTWLL